jgi:hypothetical protein
LPGALRQARATALLKVVATAPTTVIKAQQIGNHTASIHPGIQIRFGAEYSDWPEGRWHRDIQGSGDTQTHQGLDG